MSYRTSEIDPDSVADLPSTRPECKQPWVDRVFDNEIMLKGPAAIAFSAATVAMIARLFDGLVGAMIARNLGYSGGFCVAWVWAVVVTSILYIGAGVWMSRSI